MLVTVTNTSGQTINDLDVYPGTVASGGLRKNALPHPFGWIGALAAAGSRQLTMHPSDLYHKNVENGSSHKAWEEWQQMIQAGTVTMVIADQGAANGVNALDELFFIEV